MTGFKPGQALANQELWLEDLKFLKRQNFNVPKFAWQAIETQSVNLLSEEYCWKTKRNIQFNNKKFRSFDDLVQEYKCKTESAINYSGCEENKEQFDKMMNEYLDLGIIEFAKPEQQETIIINPLNCLQTKPNKFSIILHTLIN